MADGKVMRGRDHRKVNLRSLGISSKKDVFITSLAVAPQLISKASSTRFLKRAKFSNASMGTVGSLKMADSRSATKLVRIRDTPGHYVPFRARNMYFLETFTT